MYLEGARASLEAARSERGCDVRLLVLRQAPSNNTKTLKCLACEVLKYPLCTLHHNRRTDNEKVVLNLESHQLDALKRAHSG